jgi:hypothetical protein
MRGFRPPQREDVPRLDEMNSRTAATNSGRRIAPVAPPWLAPSITTSFMSGRSFASSLKSAK